MYMIQLFTFSQMPSKRIIVGTEPIHLETFNAALNTVNERQISIARYCCRMTAKGN